MNFLYNTQCLHNCESGPTAIQKHDLTALSINKVLRADIEALLLGLSVLLEKSGSCRSINGSRDNWDI